MNKLIELLKKYSDKRRGETIEESFEQLKKSFKASVELLIEEKKFNELQTALAESFAKELFDKYTNIQMYKIEGEEKEKLTMSMKEAKKEISEFVYVNQWWKNKHLESTPINKFFLITESNKFCFSDDIMHEDFKESMLYNTVVSDPIKIAEGVTYSAPNTKENNSEMPTWVKKLASGIVSITESTELKKTLEFSQGGLSGKFIATREDENSDFWNIQKESTHSHDKCMNCDKPPTHEVLWAEGHGHAWFCESDLRKWAKEHKDDIVYAKEVKDGIAASKFAENTNPNILDKLDL